MITTNLFMPFFRQVISLPEKHKMYGITVLKEPYLLVDCEGELKDFTFYTIVSGGIIPQGKYILSYTYTGQDYDVYIQI